MPHLTVHSLPLNHPYINKTKKRKRTTVVSTIATIERRFTTVCPVASGDPERAADVAGAALLRRIAARGRVADAAETRIHEFRLLAYKQHILIFIRNT